MFLLLFLSNITKDKLFTNTKPLIPILFNNLEAKGKESWRRNLSLFKEDLSQQELASGLESFAIAWYQLGHAVSFILKWDPD